MKIRWDGDTVYVEPTLSEAERQRGVYEMGELHKPLPGIDPREQGFEYGCNRRIRFSCQYNSGTQILRRVSHQEFYIKLKSVKPNRIEGLSFAPPDSATFDCQYCAYIPAGSEWKPFAWIPVE